MKNSDTPADKTGQRIPADKIKQALTAIDQQIGLLQLIIDSLNTSTPIIAEHQLLETWYPQTRAVFEQDVNGQFVDELDAVVKRVVPEPSSPQNSLGYDFIEQVKAIPVMQAWIARYRQKLFLISSALNKFKQDIANDPEKYLSQKVPVPRTEAATSVPTEPRTQKRPIIPITYIKISFFVVLIAAGSLVFWHPLALSFVNQFSNPFILQTALFVGWAASLVWAFGYDRKNIGAFMLVVGIACSVLQIAVQRKNELDGTAHQQKRAVTDQNSNPPQIHLSQPKPLASPKSNGKPAAQGVFSRQALSGIDVRNVK